MPHYSPSLNTRRFCGIITIAIVILLVACTTKGSNDTQTQETVLTTDTSLSIEQAVPLFSDLLQKGEYAGVIELVQKTDMPVNERNGILGNMILDGLVDQKAITRPAYTLEEGMRYMETAAAAGRIQSVSDLRGKFTTGLNDAGKGVVMPPNPDIAACWQRVEGGQEQATTCINLRKKLKFP